MNPSCHSPETAALAAPTASIDPGVVVVELEAAPHAWEIAPGRTVAGYAFNGQVPGPVIHARRGVPLEVRFTNRLPEPTLVHWHGLRVPATMDGTQDVQRPVQPGESFTYRFTPPDAGTFWYHPHANETEQLEKGLYGALIVHGEDEPVLDADRVLVLDDLKLNPEGTAIAEFRSSRPIAGFKERHDGREGDVRLVNGKAEPELTMAAGQVERWRFVNASSARYVRLSIGGRPFSLLGTDGGLLGAPVSMREALLTPGDRVDIAVGPFDEGETIRVESLPYNRRTFARTRTELFATVRVGAAKPSKAVVAATLRRIE